MAANDPSSEPDREPRGFLAPPPGSHPVDHCVRCGIETPAGVALCEEHNPQHISGPSATQMHATVFGGIAVGVIGLFVLFNFVTGNTGPYEAEVTSSREASAGGVALVFTVANEGDAEGIADCRVTRDGIPRPDDLAFRTERVPGGGSVSIEKVAPGPPAGSIGYVPDLVTVMCS